MVETRSEWRTAAPAPALRPHMEGYHGYRMLGFAPGLHRGPPSGHVTFIVRIGEPIDVVAQTDATHALQRYRCVLSGLQASPARIARDGNQEGVAIELTPVGFRSLFGVPARALWNTSLELDDVVRSVGTELWERLQTTTEWRQRFAVCDEVLGRLLGDGRVAPELRWAWARLVQSGGAVSVRGVPLG